MNNLEKGLRAISFLALIMAQSAQVFASDFRKDWEAKNVELKAGAIKHRVSYQGSQELLESGTNRLDGITDFQGQYLDPSTNVVATHIGFGFVETTTAANPAAVKYDSDRDNIPAVVQNADLEIWQSGKRVFTMPVRHLMTQVNSDVNGADMLALDSFLMLRGGVQTEIKFKLPSGNTLTAGGGNTIYLSVEIRGFVTSRKTL